MSWMDRISVAEVLKLRDEFNINTAVETGTFKGVWAELYAHYFKEVLSIEISEEYLRVARERLSGRPNVQLHKMPSWEFLDIFTRAYHGDRRVDTIYFYLDAHFYDPALPPEDKWVVVKELKALRGFKSCVICIHDYDCEGLGHLIYDGQHLGWNIIGEDIARINPDFHYYTNTREWCDIYNEETIKELPITVDEHVIESLRFASRSDVARDRGILYATPRKLDLIKFRLKEI